jgi:hypothetical protein
MPGARSILKKTTDLLDRPVVFRNSTSKRAGVISTAEKQIIKQFVADQPTEITNQQVNALATLTRRSKETILAILTEARDEFAASAVDYVQMHKQGVQSAIANGDAKSLDAGIRGAQWAIEHQGRDGHRVIDAPKTEGKSGSAQIMIGIKLGGKNEMLPEIVDGKILDE